MTVLKLHEEAKRNDDHRQQPNHFITVTMPAGGCVPAAQTRRKKLDSTDSAESTTSSASAGGGAGENHRYSTRTCPNCPTCSGAIKVSFSSQGRRRPYGERRRRTRPGRPPPTALPRDPHADAAAPGGHAVAHAVANFPFAVSPPPGRHLPAPAAVGRVPEARQDPLSPRRRPGRWRTPRGPP